MFIKKIIVAMLIFVSAAFSQKGNLAGTITDENSNPVSYATVQLKELLRTVSSDANGKFTFKSVPYGDYVLIVSHLGYSTKTVKVKIENKNNSIEIKLTQTPITIGEAVITGIRKPEDEKNFALPVETATSKNFDEQIPDNIGEVLEAKAGVEAARDGAWGSMLNVRGLSKQNLVYLIDGARIETSTNIAGGLALFDMNDIEKVEVIKGGLSTLYGTGATGGVVNIVTKQARFSDSPYLKGTLLSGYQTVNNGYSTGINLFAGNEMWKAKISASKRKADDVKIPDGYLTNSNYDDYSFSAAVGYEPVKAVELNVEYQKYKATDVGIPGGAAFPATATADYLDAERELFAATALWRNPVKHVNTLSLRYYNQWIRRVVKIVPAPGKSIEPSSDHRTNGITLQSDAVFGKHYLIGGIDAWSRSYVGLRITEIADANTIIIDKSVPNSEFSNLGFFANDDYRINDKLKIALGGRYDFINITNDDTKNPLYTIVNGDTLDVPYNPAASFPPTDVNNESWSGNLNIVYNPFVNTALTFSLAKTFRSPSLEERYQYINLGGIIYLGNPDLQPEKSFSLDAGIRYYGKRFSIKGDVYANFFNDLVIDYAEQPESLYVKQNVGEARFLGFDLTFQAKLWKSFITGTLSYVDGRDTRADEPLPQIPPLNGSLKITAPVFNLFDFSVEGIFYADKNDVPASEERTPGYAVYNLDVTARQINLGIIKLNIYGGIKNILNRKYRNHLSTYRGISLTEPARNYYIKLIIPIG